jgi:hypothetical protein
MKPGLYRVSVRRDDGYLCHYTVEASGGGVAARKVGDETALPVINVERIAELSEAEVARASSSVPGEPANEKRMGETPAEDDE